MNLVASIAITHIRARMRQTLVGLMGVATGVGFSVMMAALMEGSQRDFVAQLVDALPHISVTDQRREPPPQPAEEAFDLAQIHGLTTPVIRPGIKNPYALIASIESWVPGAVAPSVQSKAVLRFAGRDTAASIIGIDPRREPNVSKLGSQIVSGSLADLYKSSNAIILGSGLAKKIGARVGNSVTLVGGNGRTISANVVALSRTGINQLDENQAHTLIKTAQILAGQTGLVNEIRVRTRDAMGAREVAERIEAETRYKSVSWLEANEDLLSAFQIRNFIMFAVVGAILLVASFGTYNIISTITHEKTRDIAIMKSLGLPSRTVRRIFVLEALIIGVMGVLAGWVLGYVMSLGMGQVEFRSPFMDATRLPILYSPLHYILAGAVALAASAIAGFFPARKAAAVQPVEIIRGAS
ncbi:MAG: ABC transporter permease [Beijerinckiaceae bacterium]|nr:ABC transporter permease [Beijerinckiaceae bacterium]